MRGGRPLRFLLLTLGGWTLVRAAALWPEPNAVRATSKPSAARARPAMAAVAPDAAPTPAGALPGLPSVTGPIDQGQGRIGTGERALRLDRTRIATGSVAIAAPPPAISTSMLHENSATPRLSQPRTATDPPGPQRSPSPSRLRGDSWLVARPGGGENLAFGQLGASQAGVRLTYAVDADRRLSVSGRLSAPLRGRGREAALGVEWRPTTLPLSLLVEQRVPLDGGPMRPAAQLIGGVATRLPNRLQLEAYAQAGAVYRRGGFADGAARLTRPLLTSRVATVDIGAGGWGAVQRDVGRLDLGPTLGISLPARGGSVRLGADYRLRVAGRARPGSGPALTIGTSF